MSDGMPINSGSNKPVNNNFQRESIKKEDFISDEKLSSIFNQLDTDGDGELSQAELNKLSNTIKFVSGQSGNITKKQAKGVMILLGIKNVSAKALCEMYSKLKQMSAEIANNPKTVIRNKYGLKNVDIKTNSDGSYRVLNGQNRFICDASGRKLESWKDGALQYSFKSFSYDSDGNEHYGNDMDTSNGGLYVDAKGQSLGAVDKDGNLSCYTKEGERFVDVLYRFGVTEPEDIQAMIKANPQIKNLDTPMWSTDSNGQEIQLHAIVPSDLADKLDLSNLLIPSE